MAHSENTYSARFQAKWGGPGGKTVNSHMDFAGMTNLTLARVSVSFRRGGLTSKRQFAGGSCFGFEGSTNSNIN